MKRYAFPLILLLVSVCAHAQVPLQQSTASQAVKLGPFLDDTDGKTAETGLTIANTDVKLSKNGGTIGNKNSGGCTHDAGGWYTCTLDATDTNTAGRLTVSIAVSGALPVFREYMVYPTALYAALYTTAPGAAGGLLQAGTNADFDVTANASFAGGVTITQSASNTAALVVTGNGTGNGATFTSGGGATGNGLQATAASTNGSGIGLTATGSGTTMTLTPSNVTQIAGQTASASGTVTFPNATLASTTNITAGTITTATNLTNAPTAGDFTATMKTSIGTAVAASAVASVTGNVGGNVTGSVGSVASGGITAASIATDAITAAKIAADAIGASEIATGAIGAAQIAAGAIVETTFATTAGSFKPLGIIDQGTAQSATGTTLVLRSALAMADDTANGMTLVACGSTQGYCQARAITDYTSSSDTATVDTWTVTPSGTITYYLFGTAPSTGGGGGGLDAAGVRAAVGLASANLDTQLGAIDDFVDTEVAAIKAKTDFLPSATAGAAGGLFIAGTNAATTITTGLTTNLTGNVSGSVGSVTGAVGSVTGAVGSVTGNVGGTVNGLTSTAQGNVRTGVGLASANLDTQLAGITAPTAATVADAVWDEARTGHTTAGTFGNYLDASISGVSTGGVSAGDIADAVWDEVLSGHVTSGTGGERLGRIPNVAAGASGGLPTVDANNAVKLQSGTGANQISLSSGAVLLQATQTGVTIPNVTTVATTTNLTNAPTSGDLTATMKTSAQTAAAAALTAYDPPTRAEATSDAGSILAALSALPNSIRDLVIEDQGGGVTLGCAVSAVLAVLAGDSTATGGSSVAKDPSGSETRVTGTVSSAGNRLASLTCPSY